MPKAEEDETDTGGSFGERPVADTAANCGDGRLLPPPEVRLLCILL